MQYRGLLTALAGTACLIAVSASPTQASPLPSLALLKPSQASPIEQIHWRRYYHCHRRCWWHRGHRHCRRVCHRGGRRWWR